jgi:hypothetical protein
MPRKSVLKSKHLKAACMAAGLATAWGGQQAATYGLEIDTTYEISGWVQPTQNLSRVYVGTYFWTGSPAYSSWTMISPEISAGERYDFSFEILSIPEEEIYRAGYTVLGVYGNETDGKSFMVALNALDAQDALGQEWLEYISQAYQPPTEAEIIEGLENEAGLPASIGYRFGSWIENSFRPDHPFYADRVGDQFGTTTELTNFTAATPGGQAYVDARVVPEPTTVSLAGVVIMIAAVGRRKP